MLKVGVTGGIGSGKSTVCRVFQALGIPVLDADSVAGFLMEHDAGLMGAIKNLLGEEVYVNHKLQRPMVASRVFADPELLRSLNALVHPATTSYAHKWHLSCKAPYTIKEAAIFFESGTDKEMDVMIGVLAPADLRIERAMRRSNLTREEVQARMARQMDEEQKMNLCQYVILNDDRTPVLPQVLALHKILCGAGVNP